MPIHEKSLIREENISVQEELSIDGVDVSGHWSTFIEPRVVSDYNEELEEEISALPGGEYIHRCWQCGSCTNSCTVNAIDPEFNPRFWIYLIRTGMEEELLRDKERIWQCVSCNQCTYACPRDVFPEGVMKATAHWLELKGHTPKSPSMVFDEIFTEQVIATGKIEEGRTLRRFLERTSQPLIQDWIIDMGKKLLAHLPIAMLTKMGIGSVFAPRTRGWTKASEAIQEYQDEQQARHRKALKIEELITMAEHELTNQER
ncbi:MAG TPA: heterodisulfide reductase subunit C [Gammaproteobacteria bacterium]|nr:heterodisulfide reductase subunit C [Gammaproteobacteria bacterium]|tara:strand:+ start:3680 stop:4456 length:777 start_codon:yes stop_codon:yes gene_type:complete